jgi:hypothetical protein
LGIDFPSGTYDLEVETGYAGWLGLSVAMDGSHYPPIPTLVDLNGMSGVNPNVDLRLEWALHSGAGLEDRVPVTMQSLAISAIPETAGGEMRKQVDSSATNG